MEKNSNDSSFDPRHTPRHESPLDDMTFYWLGSSVTYGASAEAKAVPDYLQVMTGSKNVKEAVSGTTILTEEGSNSSYVKRMESTTDFDKNAEIVAFICTVSTNDAMSTYKENWGEVTADNVTDLEEFDLSTTMGGLEYIINYVKQTWDCPVYLYSSSHITAEGVRSTVDPTGADYAALVEKVDDVLEKYSRLEGYTVKFIDMFNDEEFNAVVSDEYFDWSMSDPIHPNKAAYMNWWTPYFAAFLENELNT